MKRSKFVFTVAILLSVFVSSCSHDEAYSKFCSFPKAVWDRENPALFDVDIKDASAYYSIMVEVRNNNEYPFRNLWLYIDTFGPAGSLKKDTLNIELADMYGKWYGKGMSLYTYSFPLETLFQYPDTGRYTYRIRQGMRQEDLPGISDIGLTISKNSH